MHTWYFLFLVAILLINGINIGKLYHSKSYAPATIYLIIVAAWAIWSGSYVLGLY